MSMLTVITTVFLIAVFALIVIRKIPKKAVLPALAGAMMLRLAAAVPLLAGTGLLRRLTELL
ncbi:hypothetical protein QWJ34_09780 [Saccharibacillus sp. CPCC 101409]|uniref:hypothetical protein n=1 Tax=Saccharibacillus sp. CPCC 101409 TaxID=3058041 RepID=UPI002671457F|nr:hypothetical protein [Saccharibacillus sp. CPCC 101409]MDO3410049.1 hypothetical protein [Saccharibacillus sp. CPCC 101409]